MSTEESAPQETQPQETQPEASQPQESKTENRSRPITDELREFIRSGWAAPAPGAAEPSPAAPFARERRERLAARFPGERLVVPAGTLKVRSNDTDYVFRPHTAFAYLTGLGSDRDPDAVLVLDPDGEPQAVLYLRPGATFDSDAFFTDARHGEFWVGPRPTLEHVAQELGLETRDRAKLDADLAEGASAIRLVRDADPTLTAAIDELRDTDGADTTRDDELAHDVSTMRLVKDPHEIDQMRLAIDATHRAFDAVVAALPEAVARGRGERWVEGTFGRQARHLGNTVGYDSICAAGDHANTLHWIRNTGSLVPGEMILIDAGIEVDSLYTADITRTLPINGTYSPAQREVYEAVLAAQQAGLDAVRPGNKFSDVHAAAIRVIAEHLYAWGLLPDGVGVEETLDKEHGQYHQRWMVHGTSHHLGLDVHDCALATRSEYLDADLLPGMILTVEPGLYFKRNDLLAPERFRGIGVRIEDDVLVTPDGHENLSAAIPRTADDVEAWIASLT